MIERTEHTVPVPYLPEALRGLRIAQLSDLHRSHLTSDRVLRAAVQMANDACPDLIVLTGDYVSQDTADIEPCMRLLKPLRARMGIYAVLGNHDYNASGRGVAQALTRIGVEVLVNRNVSLRHGLRLAGLDDSRKGKPDVRRALEDIGPEEPLLILTHNPADAEKLAHRACVVLSGHTHGGQILLPILTANEIRRIGAKRYRAGWYTIGKARVYVNRGLGQVGYPIRLFCPPEVSVFTLEPACQPQRDRIK
ncbi:MAG TPA: metallophosphoesterase [Chthonomonadaceae bacterium]|nr:metallophosphoesterase [Chthonomonadaceae bacterium]